MRYKEFSECRHEEFMSCFVALVPKSEASKEAVLERLTLVLNDLLD